MRRISPLLWRGVGGEAKTFHEKALPFPSGRGRGMGSNFTHTTRLGTTHLRETDHYPSARLRDLAQLRSACADGHRAEPRCEFLAKQSVPERSRGPLRLRTGTTLQTRSRTSLWATLKHRLRHPPRNARSLRSRSIPQTTNRKTVLLTVVDPVRIAIDVIQVAEPRVVGIVLGRTPPETEVANVEVISIVAAAAPGSP